MKVPSPVALAVTLLVLPLPHNGCCHGAGVQHRSGLETEGDPLPPSPEGATVVVAGAAVVVLLPFPAGRVVVVALTVVAVVVVVAIIVVGAARVVDAEDELSSSSL